MKLLPDGDTHGFFVSNLISQYFLNKRIVLTSSKSKMIINCPKIRMASTDLKFSEKQKYNLSKV